MAKNTPTPYDLPARPYDEAVQWLRDNSFDIQEAPGTSNRTFLRKYNCSAAIERTEDGGVRVFAWPGYVIGNEIAKLINRGYQQFFKTTKTEVAATADKLRNLQKFSEEFKEALNLPSLYNEALGTVSENYHYDRLNGRDTTDGPRPVRPWEEKRLKAKKKA